MPPLRPTAAGAPGGALEINWSQLMQSKNGSKGILVAAGAVFVAALGAPLILPRPLRAATSAGNGISPPHARRYAVSPLPPDAPIVCSLRSTLFLCSRAVRHGLCLEVHACGAGNQCLRKNAGCGVLGTGVHAPKPCCSRVCLRARATLQTQSNSASAAWQQGCCRGQRCEHRHQGAAQGLPCLHESVSAVCMRLLLHLSTPMHVHCGSNQLSPVSSLCMPTSVNLLCVILHCDVAPAPT